MILNQIKHYRLTKIFISRPAVKKIENKYKVNRTNDKKLYLLQEKTAKQKRLRRHP